MTYNGLTTTALILIALCVPANAPAQVTTQINLSSLVNADVTTYGNADNYPQKGGPLALAGVPFTLTTIASSSHTGVIQGSGDSGVQQTVSIPINSPGITTVYTLINSAYGSCGSAVGELDFIGAASATYVYTLREGVNIRDHNQYIYCNTATDLAGTASFGAGQVRLDMQKITLPSSFAADTLVSITFKSFGQAFAGVPFIAAITLASATGNQPVISATQGVVNGASFQENFASGTWLTLRGSKLSSTTRIWQTSDFNGTSLPTSLDGVQVTVNGKSAYVYYITPTQVNVLTPDDSTTGPVPVQIVTKDGASTVVTATKSALAPAFFAYSQQSGRYVVAQNAGTYALIGPNGLLGSSGGTRPATSGETLAFYATGLGSTSPSYLTGQLIPAPATLSNPVQVLIGGVAATTTFAGIVGSGLYQLNVVVPTLPSGDSTVVLKIGNAQSQANAYIPISNPPPLKSF